MPQEAASGLVVVDPDASSSLPPSSSLPRTQLSPETLRALVLKCGREAEGEASCLSAAAPSTSNALKARDRLRGQLGFCFDPMPWEQAVAAIADGGVEAMGQMGRTPEGVARYWRWRDEDFPYNFEDGIEHSNVWALAPLAPRQLEAFVEERRPHCDFETAWFVNPVALASIPDVWHAHVLSKRRRRKEGEGVEEKGA